MKVARPGKFSFETGSVVISGWSFVYGPDDPVVDLNTPTGARMLLPVVLSYIAVRYGVVAEMDAHELNPTLEAERITASAIAEAKWGGRPDLWNKGGD